MDSIRGYKTYLAALALALNGVVKLLNGDHSGLTDLFTAAGLAGLRNAVHG